MRISKLLLLKPGIENLFKTRLARPAEPVEADRAQLGGLGIVNSTSIIINI